LEYIYLLKNILKKGCIPTKLIKTCSQEEVWRHWNKIEKHESVNTWRWDIKSPIPLDIKWYVAEIEERDVNNIYIISSDDWKTITKSFKLLEVVDALNKGIYDDKITNILEKKVIYQKDIDGLDRTFVFVSPSVDGNFTILEGNKRAVALQSLNKLVGNHIYLGISRKIEQYLWARYSIHK
jgi:hypothetical protein